MTLHVVTPTNFNCMWTNITNMLLHHLSTHRSSNILTCVSENPTLPKSHHHLIPTILMIVLSHLFIYTLLSQSLSLDMCLTPKITTRGNSITQSLFDPRIDNNLINSPIDDPDVVDNCSYISLEELHNVDPTNGTLSILQLNMQGLINKQSNLNKLLQAGSRNKVCVALLCEIWLQRKRLN